MYIVKRPFKNNGTVFTAGTVLTDPAVIKHLKSRIKEGKVLEVNEQQLLSYKTYFKDKYGVDIIVEQESVEPINVTTVEKETKTVEVKAKVEIPKVTQAKVSVKTSK